MYAIIETGGKQYKVSEGDIVQVERLDASVGDTIEIDRVLMHDIPFGNLVLFSTGFDDRIHKICPSNNDFFLEIVKITEKIFLCQGISKKGSGSV